MNNLTVLRKQRGLSQQDVSEAIGVSRQAYSHYETGKRQPDIMIYSKLAEFFQVSIETLIGNGDNMNTIRKLRKEQSMTMKQLGALVGVSESSISLYETGKHQPDNQTLVELSKVFGVSVDCILGLESDNLSTITNTRFSSDKKISVLGRVPAGVPIEAVQFIVDDVDLPSSLAATEYDYFALLVSGDSMFPEYVDGDIVIVRKQESAETGDDVVAYVNGYDATLKRLIRSEKGITLRAINPAYDSKIYSNQDVIDLPIKIAGVVVEQRRSRK